MSHSSDLEKTKQGFVLVSQIISFALIGGVVMFAAIAFLIGPNQPGGGPLVAYLAAGFAGIALVLQAFVPALVVSANRNSYLNSQPRQDPRDRAEAETRLMPLFQTKHIIRMALLEGAAFFCLVAYLVSGLLWLYAIVAALVALMVVSLPTRSALDHWLEEQLQLLELST
jgi:hypothetical protein